MSEVKLTHAGALVFRRLESQILYLVVSSSDGQNWVLPKGHIDPGESPETAALRELQEEAGVLAELVAPLSVHQFQMRGVDATVQYFLVRESGSTDTIEKRTIRWEDEKSAFELLSFGEAKAALLEGAKIARDS